MSDNARYKALEFDTSRTILVLCKTVGAGAHAVEAYGIPQLHADDPPTLSVVFVTNAAGADAARATWPNTTKWAVVPPYDESCYGRMVQSFGRNVSLSEAINAQSKGVAINPKVLDRG